MTNYDLNYYENESKCQKSGNFFQMAAWGLLMCWFFYGMLYGGLKGELYSTGALLFSVVMFVVELAKFLFINDMGLEYGEGE